MLKEVKSQAGVQHPGVMFFLFPSATFWVTMMTLNRSLGFCWPSGFPTGSLENCLL